MCCFVARVEYFQQSHPIPTYKAGIKVMCCSLWLHVLEFIFPPTLTYKAGIKVMLLFVITCESIFQQSYPIPPIKQGLSDVLLFCDSMLE
jgi:hypothetical protein